MKIFLTFVATLLISACNNDDSQSPIQVNLTDRIEIDSTSLNKEHSNKKTFYFGFDLRSSLQEDARQYIPFLQYLESTTGYNFKLHFTKNNSSIIDDLGNNRVQFAAMGAMSYLNAKIKFSVIPLVQGLNLANKSEYRSYLVVKPNSPILSITDIKNKRLAFGGQSSTQGHLIPRILLHEYKIKLTDLADYTYSGSHQLCAETVISGRYDVCGMQDVLAEEMEKEGLLRIIHRSDFFPASGIIANTQVPVEVFKTVQQALLDFKPIGKDKTHLYHWQKTEMPLGFVIATTGNYDKLEHWAKKLGFIDIAPTDSK